MDCKKSSHVNGFLEPKTLNDHLKSRNFTPFSIHHFLQNYLQNGLSVQEGKKSLETLNTHHLNKGQTFLLSPPGSGDNCAHLIFNKGFGRLAGSFGGNFSDITLAFFGSKERHWLRFSMSSNFLLEALSDSSIQIEYLERCPKNNDSIKKWLFDLNLVRHSVGAEARLISLINLLVSRFGVTTNNGYLLPFSLEHSRIAELIGVTRSTVTRKLALLKSQNDLVFDTINGQLLISDRLIKVEV